MFAYSKFDKKKKMRMISYTKQSLPWTVHRNTLLNVFSISLCSFIPISFDVTHFLMFCVSVHESLTFSCSVKVFSSVSISCCCLACWSPSDRNCWSSLVTLSSWMSRILAWRSSDCMSIFLCSLQTTATLVMMMSITGSVTYWRK